MSSSMKVALVLFVKNEISDISSWVSWHLALGFDHIYIYDDHSTDGTYEACRVFSKIYNIEVERSDNKKETNFFWRQRDSYFDACQKASGIYEWIAFLDSDEYLYLEETSSVQSYLNKFDKFNAIALNWRIYGSSGRVVKDHVPVYEAFTSHSNKEFGDNRLVKSFIRPDKYSYVYSDPHRFHMNNECYADSTGNNFEWQNSTKDVEWKGANINHYICRSMEHYVSRIKRRLGVDLHNSSVYWDHFNRNEIAGLLNHEVNKKANEINQKLKEACVSNYINKIKEKNKFPKVIERKNSLKLYNVKTNKNNYICLNNIDGHVVQNNDSLYHKYPIFAARYGEEETVYLIHISIDSISNIYFHVNESNLISYCYAFKLEKLDDCFVLKSLINARYLCFVPPEKGGEVSCNRLEASEWEKILLVESDITLNSFSSPFFVDNYDNFLNYINLSSDISYVDFLIAVSKLNKVDKDRVIYDSGNTISWIL